MARDWKARPTPKPTSITEVARRYHAAAVALAQSLGISLAEVLAQYPSAVSTVFIECSRCELRLPASVTLPPLTPPTAHGHQPPAAAPAVAGEFFLDAKKNLDGRAEFVLDANKNSPPADPAAPPGGEPQPNNGDTPALPTAIPADGDLPCAGQEIATLKPAALAMLIAKTATLAHAEGAGWAPLLHALQSERAKRLAKGRRPLAVVLPPDGEV